MPGIACYSETDLDLSWVLANIGASICCGLGAMGLFAPARAAAFTSIAPTGLLGVSEVRATYGGLFAALGLTCLALQSQLAFCVAGLAWLGAAAGRGFSVLIDRHWAAKNLGGIVFEGAIGLLLLAPTLL